MDQQDHVDLKDLEVIQEGRVPKVRLELKGSKESLEFPERQDLLAPKDQEVLSDFKVFRALLV
jgi:hypothetical protein